MSDDTQETPGTAQSASELVRRVQALAQDDERHEQAISSLRWACDEDDWLACAAQANAMGSGVIEL